MILSTFWRPSFQAIIPWSSHLLLYAMQIYALLFVMCLKGAIAQGHMVNTGEGRGNQNNASDPVLFADDDAVQGITLDTLLAEADALLKVPRDCIELEHRYYFLLCTFRHGCE